MTDDSNGYEGIAAMYINGRGQAVNGIGSSAARVWARTLNSGSVVLDVGCGTGIPVTKILLDAGLTVYALDASPTMIKIFRQNFPDVPVACEAVEQSTFFDRTFDGIIAVGLMFLLPEENQRVVIRKMASALNPGGKLVFTAPVEKIEWNDAMTELPSRSLGGEQYRALLAAEGLSVGEGFQDEGGNHYFEAHRLA